MNTQYITYICVYLPVCSIHDILVHCLQFTCLCLMSSFWLVTYLAVNVPIIGNDTYHYKMYQIFVIVSLFVMSILILLI